jgi:hypothetical protein
MNRLRIESLLTGAAFVLSLALPNCAQQQDAAVEIVEKNIQAAGGEDKISEIRNFSFKDNGTTYYLSAEGQMKMTSGKNPVITEVILVDKTSAKRNCFNKLIDLGPLLEQTFQIRARLYSGLFTLLCFKDDLEFQSKRRFGPKEHYMLTTRTKDLEIEFYVDTEDSLLKRVVFRGHNPDFGKYEINHDIGSYLEIQGLKIPSSWFVSQIGTRGNTHHVSDLKWNLELEENFFSNYDVNVGKIDFSGGILKGNIVDFSPMRGGGLMISTNWTDECIQRAGFESENQLILTIGEKQLQVDIYTSQPPRAAYREGAVLMLPSREGENFVVYILASGYQDLVESLEPLLPIQIQKKD